VLDEDEKKRKPSSQGGRASPTPGKTQIERKIGFGSRERSPSRGEEKNHRLPKTKKGEPPSVWKRFYRVEIKDAYRKGRDCSISRFYRGSQGRTTLASASRSTGTRVPPVFPHQEEHLVNRGRKAACPTYEGKEGEKWASRNTRGSFSVRPMRRDQRNSGEGQFENSQERTRKKGEFLKTRLNTQRRLRKESRSAKDIKERTETSCFTSRGARRPWGKEGRAEHTSGKAFRVVILGGERVAARRNLGRGKNMFEAMRTGRWDIERKKKS